MSNENDNLVTVIDMATRKMLDQIPTGVEPEGMAVSPDGKTFVNTSETTNMAHFIDFATRRRWWRACWSARPRDARFKPDGSEVWVSSELGDGQRHRCSKRSGDAQDRVRGAEGCAAEGIQPEDIRFTKDEQLAFVALGPANRVAVVDTKTYRVKKYLLVGQRVWHWAFTPDGKVPSNDQRVVQRRIGHRRRIVGGGEVDSGGTPALGTWWDRNDHVEPRARRKWCQSCLRR